MASRHDRLRVACIGVCGQGEAALTGVQDEVIVALCDVDEPRMGATIQHTAEEHPDTLGGLAEVPHFADYRRLFDRMAKAIDAVTIATPDHMHFPIARAALQLGKHVYLEKPLTHTIKEARDLAGLARTSNVATQMGNQGHAAESCRLLKEWFEAGVLGEVREVHSWIRSSPGIRPDEGGLPLPWGKPDHTRFVPVIPPGLHWDLWQGVAAERPYDPAYAPGTWRVYWDFGNGMLGDWGCHEIDGPFYALELGAPSAVEAMSAGMTADTVPNASVVTMHFPARGKRPPVKYTWSDGGLMPPMPEAFEHGRNLPDNGTLIFGSKATALAGDHFSGLRLIPEAVMRAHAGRLPPKTIPRVEGGPFAEWIRACKGGPKAGANFEYAGPLTETVLLGAIAQRMQRSLEWDAAAMRVTNLEEANQLLAKEYRPGWL